MLLMNYASKDIGECSDAKSSMDPQNISHVYLRAGNTVEFLLSLEETLTINQGCRREMLGGQPSFCLSKEGLGPFLILGKFYITWIKSLLKILTCLSMTSSVGRFLSRKGAGVAPGISDGGCLFRQGG